MRRACGCRADPIVFGHTECDLGPRWVARAARDPERPWWMLR